MKQKARGVLRAGVFPEGRQNYFVQRPLVIVLLQPVLHSVQSNFSGLPLSLVWSSNFQWFRNPVPTCRFG